MSGYVMQLVIMVHTLIIMLEYQFHAYKEYDVM